MEFINLGLIRSSEKVINQLHMYYFVLIIRRMSWLVHDCWNCYISIFENVNTYG
jgi:hypothetical protein